MYFLLVIFHGKTVWRMLVVDGGEMTNTGYDFVINVIPVRTKDFTWQLSLNTSVTKNEVNKNQRINTLNDYLEGSAVVDGEAFQLLFF